MAGIQTLSTQKFKNLFFVGLNKAELHLEDGGTLVADSWRELLDERYRNKHLMLAFVTPKDVDGDPMDPLTAFTDERATPDEVASTRELLKHLALFDLSRIRPASPNRVNILGVADLLFYWDINGSYVTPTNPQNWQNDLKEIVRYYPRTTEKHLYTSWDTQGLEESSFSLHKVRELPLDSGMWLNMPTFHETYGTPFLIAGLAASALVYGTLTYQESRLTELNQNIRSFEADANRVNNLRTAMNDLAQPESDLKFRGLMSTVTKDVAIAISEANVKTESLKIELIAGKNEAERSFLTTITAERDTYTDFSAQEPVAKAILNNSATLEAVRKRPAERGEFILEGITPLASFAERVRKLNDSKRTPEPTPAPEVPQ